MNDPEIAERFVTKYKPVIKRYLTGMMIHCSSLDDLVQEIFLKIVKRLKDFRHQGSGSFRAWLRSVVGSVYFDWISDQNENVVKIEFLNGVESECLDTLPEEFAWEYDKEIMAVAILRVRLEIDPRTWQIFELAQIQREPAERVAQLFGIAVRAVYEASQRVLQRLREMVRYLDTTRS